jgi:hypothetical protein
MNVALVLSGIFFGILTARAETIAARGGIEQVNLALISISFGSMISTFAIIIWGFINLKWWIPLAGFVVISLFVGVIVGRSTWPLFYKAIPITGLITIVVTGYAWFS